MLNADHMVSPIFHYNKNCHLFVVVFVFSDSNCVRVESAFTVLQTDQGQCADL